MYIKKIHTYLGFDENNQNSKKIQKSHRKLENLKSSINNLTIETQELILKSCFKSDLELVRDNQSVRNFKNRLYKFQKYLIITEGYSFYNEFYIQMMEELDKKRELIEKYGTLEVFKEIPENLSLLETRKENLNIFKLARQKIVQLFKLYKQEEIKEIKK